MRGWISGWIGFMRIGWRNGSPGTRWRLRALASACSIGWIRMATAGGEASCRGLAARSGYGGGYPTDRG